MGFESTIPEPGLARLRLERMCHDLEQMIVDVDAEFSDIDSPVLRDLVDDFARSANNGLRTLLRIRAIAQREADAEFRVQREETP